MSKEEKEEEEEENLLINTIIFTKHQVRVNNFNIAFKVILIHFSYSAIHKDYEYKFLKIHLA